MNDGFGVVRLERPARRADELGQCRSLTGALGATETNVDACLPGPSEPVGLAAGREQLCVPVGATDPLSVSAGESLTLPSLGVCLVPDGVETTVHAPEPTWLVVVSVPGAQSRTVPGVVDLESVAFDIPSTSDVAIARLTEPLGCTEIKTNARRLEPGQAVPYHTEGSQEELFVPVAGPAATRVDGRTVDTPVGSVVRVAPETPRGAVNSGDRDAVWIMVGAPPTGGPTEWDPGAEILE